MSEQAHSTVDEEEIAQFAAIADEWWDEDGKLKPLHRLNPVRIGYIRDAICRHTDRDHLAPFPLKGMKVLDIGCGGGLVAEPLCRLGASVTGIDAAEENIAVAQRHAEEGGLKITYKHTTAEDMAAKRARYDVVTALEIVEHVADVELFVQSCAKLVKPGGLLIMSTLNRTPKAFALGIVAAEYVMHWLPRGTHDWKKFLRPSELSRHLRAHDMRTADVTGLVYNPIKREFSLSRADLDVNYLLTAEKPAK